MSQVSVMMLTTVSNVDAIDKPLIANVFCKRIMPRREPHCTPHRTLPGPARSAAEVGCPYSERGGGVQCRPGPRSTGRLVPIIMCGQLPAAGLRHQSGAGQGHVAGKSDQDEEPNGQVGGVDLPPAMAMLRRAWIGV